MCVGTKSKCNYLVCKYFEISASKSVVLGDMPEDGFEIWNDNYVSINNGMSDEMIIKIIDYHLQRKQLLEKMSDVMYKKIHRQYTFNNVSKKFLNVLDMM